MIRCCHPRLLLWPDSHIRLALWILRLPLLHASDEICRKLSQTSVRLLILRRCLRSVRQDVPEALQHGLMLLFLGGVEMWKSGDLIRLDKLGLLLGGRLSLLCLLLLLLGRGRRLASVASGLIHRGQGGEWSPLIGIFKMTGIQRSCSHLSVSVGKIRDMELEGIANVCRLGPKISSVCPGRSEVRGYV